MLRTLSILALDLNINYPLVEHILFANGYTKLPTTLIMPCGLFVNMTLFLTYIFFFNEWTLTHRHSI